MSHELPEAMRAIGFAQAGGPEVLEMGQAPLPQLGASDVLIKVAYAGVNRPDCIQRMGLYPAPAGASPILGLEVSGEIVAVGSDVPTEMIGQTVAALTPGGGYAEYCTAPWSHCLPVPEEMPLDEAAALPETLFTVWHNVFERGMARDGETLLVHGGTSGIGTMAIMLAKAIAVLGGMVAEKLNMAVIMSRRLTFTGSTLRPRSDAFKSALADEITQTAWPLFTNRELKPVMDQTFPLREAAAAHARMEAGDHIGKIVLKVA